MHYVYGIATQFPAKNDCRIFRGVIARTCPRRSAPGAWTADTNFRLVRQRFHGSCFTKQPRTGVNADALIIINSTAQCAPLNDQDTSYEVLLTVS